MTLARAGHTPAEAEADATRALDAAGIAREEGQRDAALLARSVLGWDEAQWIVRRHEAAPPDFTARFAAAIARRCRREPVAYILGEREFYGRAFRVTPAVLIPRPESESIVDEALAWLRSARPVPNPVVVDVGTGSGCLAITIAREYPKARLTAIDVSPAALDVARENAGRHGVLDRVTFLCGDLLAGVTGPVDLIISNPPYVPDTDRGTLAPEVRDFEPAQALFAGPDGLEVVRRLLRAAAEALRPGGRLIMEFGWGQADAVTRLVAGTPDLTLLLMREDLQRIPRVAVIDRAASGTVR
jgi:release factor glutamine methyltransferase